MGTTGLRHKKEFFICSMDNLGVKIGIDIRLKSIPKKNPKAIAIQEFVFPINIWPTAKATKNGDQVAEVFIPLKQASAIFLRKDFFESFGSEAERMENVPVFITLPKKCEAIWKPGTAISSESFFRSF